MHTFILSPQTASITVHDLLTRIDNGGVEVLDVQGNVVAYVISAIDLDMLTFAEAKLDLSQNYDAVKAAIQRRGGISTKQLLESATVAAIQKSSSRA